MENVACESKFDASMATASDSSVKANRLVVSLYAACHYLTLNLAVSANASSVVMRTM